MKITYLFNSFNPNVAPMCESKSVQSEYEKLFTINMTHCKTANMITCLILINLTNINMK